MGRHSDYAQHVNKALRHLEWEAVNQRNLCAAKGQRVKVIAWEDVIELLQYANHHADQFVWQPDLLGERADRPRALST